MRSERNHLLRSVPAKRWRRIPSFGASISGDPPRPWCLLLACLPESLATAQKCASHATNQQLLPWRACNLCGCSHLDAEGFSNQYMYSTSLWKHMFLQTRVFSALPALPALSALPALPAPSSIHGRQDERNLSGIANRAWNMQKRGV